MSEPLAHYDPIRREFTIVVKLKEEELYDRVYDREMGSLSSFRKHVTEVLDELIRHRVSTVMSHMKAMWITRN